MDNVGLKHEYLEITDDFLKSSFFGKNHLKKYTNNCLQKIKNVL